MSALNFLYRVVLRREVADLRRVLRSTGPPRLPAVLSREDVRRLLGVMEGERRLVASLLYGGGLRLMECLQLWVKDVELERREIRVRRGKGGRDRVTMLPDAAHAAGGTACASASPALCGPGARGGAAPLPGASVS